MRTSTNLRGLAGLLLVMILASACQTLTGRTAGRFFDDKAITTKVKSRLVMDRASNLTRVDVDVVNGIVYLHGVVDSPDAKTHAEELARQTSGVANVVNQLEVSGPASALPR